MARLSKLTHGLRLRVELSEQAPRLAGTSYLVQVWELRRGVRRWATCPRVCHMGWYGLLRVSRGNTTQVTPPLVR